MCRGSVLLWLAFAAPLAAHSADRPAADAVLHLVDGGYVMGELVGTADKQILRWQGRDFLAPFEFPLDALAAIHYPAGEGSIKRQSPYWFELANGDLLNGSLQSVNADTAEIEVAPFGRLQVDRRALRGISRRQDSAGLIYSGPNGLTGWRTGSDGAWNGTLGYLTTDKAEASAWGDFKLPARARIEVELSWQSTPDFTLSLGVTSGNLASMKQAFCLEILDDEIVMKRSTSQQGDIASLQKLAGSSRIAVQIYLDQEAGRCIVTSPQGAILAELNAKDTKVSIRESVGLLNKRGDVRLERLRIHRWNGEPPQNVNEQKSRLQRDSGEIVYGELLKFDASTGTFLFRHDSNEVQIPAKETVEVVLATPQDEAPRPMRVICRDGLQISGTPEQISRESVRLSVPGIRQPLEIPLASTASLIFQASSQEDVAPLGKPVLEMEGVRLRGTLVAGTESSERSCLVWQPRRSENAVPLRPGASGRIVYRDPPPPVPLPKRPPPQQARRRPAGFVEGFVQALATPGPDKPQGADKPSKPTNQTLHLRTGDTIPCDVVGMNEQGVMIKSPLSTVDFVAHERIKAIEMNLSPPATSGLNIHKRERLLTLPRLQRESPPTHLIRSTSGDYLRGRILSMDDRTLRIEVRQDDRLVPRESLVRIIWLHPDELKSSDETPAVEAGNASMRVQAQRRDGFRLTYHPLEFVDGALAGKSDVLGDCRVTVKDIDRLIFGSLIEQEAAREVYPVWRLRHATDPKFAQNDGDDDGGSSGTESALVGKPAPDFELSLLKGEKFRLSQHLGQVIVLDFWATWCGPCLQAMPQVERVTTEFRDRGVRLIAVNLEEAPKQISAMLERHKLDLTVALDIDGAVAAKYDVSGIPQTVVIDQKGQVHRLFVGGGPHLEEELRQALEGLFPAEPAGNAAP